MASQVHEVSKVDEVDVAWRLQWTELQQLDQEIATLQENQACSSEEMQNYYDILKVTKEGGTIVTANYMGFLQQLCVPQHFLEQLSQQPAVTQAFAFFMTFYLSKRKVCHAQTTMQQIDNVSLRLASNNITWHSAVEQLLALGGEAISINKAHSTHGEPGELRGGVWNQFRRAYNYLTGNADAVESSLGQYEQQQQEGIADTVESLVEAVTSNLEKPDVLTSTLNKLQDMTNEDEDNQVKCGAAGGVEAVVEIIKKSKDNDEVLG